MIFPKPKALKNLADLIFSFTLKSFSSRIPAELKSTKFLGFKSVDTFPP